MIQSLLDYHRVTQPAGPYFLQTLVSELGKGGTNANGRQPSSVRSRVFASFVKGYPIAVQVCYPQ